MCVSSSELTYGMCQRHMVGVCGCGWVCDVRKVCQGEPRWMVKCPGGGGDEEEKFSVVGRAPGNKALAITNLTMANESEAVSS